MDDHDVLAERFEAHRTRLRAVAYQTMGSASEADDAVQEAWLRLSRTDPGNIENLGGWLTTVVARVCLNMLQSRREQPVGMHLPESIVTDAAGIDPEAEALLADSIGPALLVILHTLAPAERLAFILHDIFAVPFDDIAAVAGRAFPFTRIAQLTLPALINGAAGVVTAADGRPITLVAFTITGAKIVAVDLIDDPHHIAEADLATLITGGSNRLPTAHPRLPSQHCRRTAVVSSPPRGALPPAGR